MLFNVFNITQISHLYEKLITKIYFGLLDSVKKNYTIIIDTSYTLL